MRRGPKNDISLIHFGNLDNTSVGCDEKSPRQFGRFRVERDSFAWGVSGRIPKCGNAVGFGTSLRIIGKCDVIGIAPEVQHTIQKMRTCHHQYPSPCRLTTEIVGGHGGPSTSRPNLVREAPDSAEVTNVQEFTQEQDVFSKTE